MISGIKGLTFDVGGTVLDWHRGVSQAFTDAGARRGLNADWPAITNEYRRRSLEAMVGQVKPSFNIDDVHHTVLEAVIKEHGLSAFMAEDREAIQRTWHELDAWPDLPAALARLRKKYAVVAFTILSTSLIVDVSRRNGLTWDCVVSCEMIGIYKARPEAYRTCAKWLGRRPDELLMVACHNFDLMAAREAGYRWRSATRTNRGRGSRPTAGAAHRGWRVALGNRKLLDELSTPPSGLGDQADALRRDGQTVMFVTSLGTVAPAEEPGGGAPRDPDSSFSVLPSGLG